jgi:hypothetical protein
MQALQDTRRGEWARKTEFTLQPVTGNLKESFSWPLENVSSSADLFSS